MKALFVLTSLLLVSPAFAQRPIYTNAELGQPLSSNRPTVSPAQLASLAAHQFRGGFVERAWQPVLSTGSSPTAGPFSDYQNVIQARRLDGSLWSDPQWQAVHYAPGFYPYVQYGGSGGRHGRSGSDRRGDGRAQRTR